MKKTTFLLCTLLGIVTGWPQVIKAQTLHAIIACNTTDRGIGEGMRSDLKNMRNAAQIIAANLDCEYDEYVFEGSDCTKSQITECISNMDVERDDVVMFFYGGHGTHAENNSNDPWPQMCMNTNIESLFFPVASLDRLISAKHPKLSVILTNCCNKEDGSVSIKPLYAQSKDATSLGNYNAEAFRKLFFENKGKVIMTSSKLGQYSWCGTNGGLFTNHLLDVFDAVGTNKISPTWAALCQSTHDRTLACNNLPGGARQEPYFEINVEGETGGSTVPPTPPVPPAPPAHSSETLFKALQTLVDHEQSKDRRLEHIAAVRNKFFTSDAHVVTVGRNGTSKIMYEDVETFLRRLALSDNIKQINVLEGTDNSKNFLITVHEVRY